MINQTGGMNKRRKHCTIEMQEIVNLYFLETANIIPFQMAVRVQICSVLWGYGCYNRLQWIRFIFQCFFSTEHFNHFRQLLFCFVCSVWSIHIRHHVSLLFTKCHTMEMIPFQEHFLLKADKLISLFCAGSSLKARQVRKQTLLLWTAFSLLWLLHWCSTFKGFFSCMRIPVYSDFSKQESLWITSPSLCDSPQSPWLLGSL